MPQLPLALVDVPMTSWHTQDDHVVLTGVVGPGTIVKAGTAFAGGLGTSQATAFTINYPLELGTNLIAILIADSTGHAKVIYREILRDP